jgi:hypothetical protein
MPSGKTFGVVNASERIILMIDEAHRTQSSDLGENLFEAFPNATRIAFTGTPLITERHGEKKTRKRFGEYIDTYCLIHRLDFRQGCLLGLGRNGIGVRDEIAPSQRRIPGIPMQGLARLLLEAFVENGRGKPEGFFPRPFSRGRHTIDLGMERIL